MTSSPTLTLAVWNTEWATLRSERGRLARSLLGELGADVLAITEGVPEVLPDHGHVITSGPDFGYAGNPSRRKVLLWSRRPWENADTDGDPALPPGRYVAGVTETPVGAVRVVGVCIPWHHAHVRSGRRDREPWQDHLAYLEGLRRILEIEHAEPTVVAGDFNQRVPRSRQPVHVYEALQATLGDRYEMATAGDVDGVDAPLIDHVAHDPRVAVHGVRGWQRVHGSGTRLSDHDGAIVSLGRPADI